MQLIHYAEQKKKVYQNVQIELYILFVFLLLLPLIVNRSNCGI